MKKLQVIKGDELQPYTNYAQVKDGRVVVTNGMCLLNLSAKDVFGDEVEGEWYIDRKMWGLLKFPSAKFISVNGATVKNITAGTEYTMLTPAQFCERGIYPDWKSVIPDTTKPLSAVERIVFNPALLKELVDAWGVERPRFNFYGPDKAMILDADNNSGWALLMPVVITAEMESAFYNTPDPLEI